jgi:hypothetical protein
MHASDVDSYVRPGKSYRSVVLKDWTEIASYRGHLVSWLVPGKACPTEDQ